MSERNPCSVCGRSDYPGHTHPFGTKNEIALPVVQDKLIQELKNSRDRATISIVVLAILWLITAVMLVSQSSKVDQLWKYSGLDSPKGNVNNGD